MRDLSLRTVVPVMLVATTVLLATMIALSLFTFSLLNREVAPALQDNARVIGQSVGERIERALELGIPFDALVGVDDFLREVKEDGAGIVALALADAEGRVPYAVGLPPGIAPEAVANAPQVDVDAGPEGAWWRDAGTLLDRLFSVLLAEPDGAGVEFLALPMERDGERIGTVYVGIDPVFIARQLQDTAIDIAIVIAVALLAAFEALLLVVAIGVNGPLSQIARLNEAVVRRRFDVRAKEIGAHAVRRVIAKANASVAAVDARARALQSGLAGLAGAATEYRDRLAALGGFSGALGPTELPSGQLIGARGAAFLFVLAEELARPFLPLFFRDLAAPGSAMDPALAIAIPISAFMLFTALAGPLAAAWSDRVGRRTTFMVGAALSTAGLAGTALAGGFVEVTLWRSLSGVGYALTFVACQGHVLDRTTEADRTRGLSVFVGGVFVADICGPAIGGILADQLGYAATLLVSAGVAGASVLIAVALMDDRARPEGEGRRVFAGFASIPRCARNLRFMATVILAAVPAKMLLTGFLFYLAPLILSDLGASDSEIGRLAMIYGVSALLLMPLFASLCDRLQAHGFMVGLGGLVAGAGLVPLIFGAHVWLVAIAILALGVGQAMSISAQAALVTIVTRERIAEEGPGPVLGVYRLVERLGAAVGPLVAAQLAQSYGFEGAAYVFGLAAIVAATLFSAFFLSVGVEPEPPLVSFDDKTGRSA